MKILIKGEDELGVCLKDLKCGDVFRFKNGSSLSILTDKRTFVTLSSGMQHNVSEWSNSKVETVSTTLTIN